MSFLFVSTWNKSAPTGWIVVKFDFRTFFWKCLHEMEVLLKSDKNSGYYTWIPLYIYDSISLSSSYNAKSSSPNMYTKSKHILYSVTFCPGKSYRLCDNVKIYGKARQATDDNVAWHMRFACWITKAANAQSEYVILTAFSVATLVTRTRFSVTIYINCLSCLTIHFCFFNTSLAFVYWYRLFQMKLFATYRADASLVHKKAEALVLRPGHGFTSC